MQDVQGLSQTTATGSSDFAASYLASLEALKDSATFPIPRKVKFALVSVSYGPACASPSCIYVTRVKFTASVYGGENVLSLVGDNFAALIYNYEFQAVLQRAYPAAYISQYGSLRLQVGGNDLLPSSQPSVQPSTHPTHHPVTARPSVAGATISPSRAPTFEPSSAPIRPTAYPVDSSGCVQISIVGFQQYQTYFADVPSFGSDGQDVTYIVTMSVVGQGYASFGPSTYDRYQSNYCYGTTYSPPGGWSIGNGVYIPCTDTYVSRGGVYFRLYRYADPVTLTASVCPSRNVPTTSPTTALTGKFCPMRPTRPTYPTIPTVAAIEFILIFYPMYISILVFVFPP